MISTVSKPESRAKASTASRSRSGRMAETNPSFIVQRLASERDPAAMALALGNRLAEQRLAVTVGKRGVEWFLGTPAGPDILINRAVQLLERVGKPLVVA